MPAPVLISPDNRLLGWALNDLTLYGGQPGPTVTIGRAADTPAMDQAVVASPDLASSPAPSDPQSLAPETSSFADDGTVSPTPLAGGVAATPIHPATASVTAEPEPAVAPSLGSGTVGPIQVATPLQAFAADHGGSDTDALSVPTMAAVPAINAASVGVPLADVAHAVAAVPDFTPVSVPLDALPAALGSIVDPVVHAVEGSPADTVASLVAPVAPLADTALSGFGGTDPAAGIHTLVNMVQDSDTFVLGHGAATDATPAPSLVDTLAADEAPAALLGDAAHHVDSVEGVDHHLHLGL